MKKIVFIIMICIFLTACNVKSIDQIQEVDYTENIIFYNRDEKIANNNEFDKGSGIESINLNNEDLESLLALGKIWGYLKCYHPNVAKGEYNWDYELF